MSIRQWFRNWLLKDDRGDEIKIDSANHDDHYDNHRNTIRFTVSTARGGCIVSVRTYDERKDENVTTVHVIHDDQDIAQNIAHIVSMELLRSG